MGTQPQALKLAHYLALFPGRKNVMWLSGSFPLSFFPETNRRGDHRKSIQASPAFSLSCPQNIEQQ